MLLTMIGLVWWLSAVLLAAACSSEWRRSVAAGTGVGLVAGIGVGALIAYVYPVTEAMLGWLWYAASAAHGAVAAVVAAVVWRIWRGRRRLDGQHLHRSRMRLGIAVTIATTAGAVSIATGATEFEFYRYRWPFAATDTRGPAYIAMTADGAEIALAARDGSLYVATTRDDIRERVSRPISRRPLSAVAYDATDQFLACGDRAGKLSIVRRTDMHRICTLDAGPMEVTAAEFIPGSTRLVSCSGNGVGPAKLTLWDIDQCETVRELTLQDCAVDACAVSGKGDLIAIECGTTVKLLSTTHLSEIAKFVHPTAVRDVAFSADSNLLAVGIGRGDLGGEVHIWHVQRMTRLRVFQHGGAVHYVGFLRDGALVVSGNRSQPELRVWSMADGEVLHILRDSRYPVFDLATAGARETCAAVFSDGRVALWDVAD